MCFPEGGTDFVVFYEDGECDIDLFLMYSNEWALMEDYFIVLHMKTTDEYQNEGAAMRLSANLVSRHGEVVSRYDRLIASRKVLSDQLLKQQKLSRLEYEECSVSKRVAWTGLMEFVDGRPIFFHGADFSLEHFRKELSQLALQCRSQFVDTFDIATAAWNIECYSIQGMAKRLSIERSGASCPEDVTTILRILQAEKASGWDFHTQRLASSQVKESRKYWALAAANSLH
jgi:hypothetical protein